MQTREFLRMKIGDRIKLAAKAVGGQRALSGLIDVSERSLSSYVAGTSSPQLDTLQKIADVTNTDFAWLAVGGSNEVPENSNGLAFAPSDMVLVPIIDAQPSAGGGSLVEAEPVAGMIAVHRELLRSLGVNTHGALRILEVRGDSMEPTIRAGELILIDTSIESVEHEGIYVFRFAGALVVKRIRFSANNCVELISDNGGASERIPEADLPDLHAAGRVVRVIRAL